MKKEIPFLSGPDGTEVPGYSRFKYLRALLAQKTAEYRSLFKADSARKEKLTKFARFCGYGDSYKFAERLKIWVDAAQDIPLCMFEYLEIEKGDIDSAVEKDMRAFLAAAAMPMYPRSFTVRLMPAVYTGGEIPEGMSEDAAIAYVENLLNEKGTGIGFSLNYPEMKTVFVKPDGTVNTLWYPPEVEWTKTHLVVGSNGLRVGKSYIR